MNACNAFEAGQTFFGQDLDLAAVKRDDGG
jgi:hypothetical protein